MFEKERKMAKVVLEEIFDCDNNVGERAKIWILARIEEYAWKQYKYIKREMEYIIYVQKMVNTKAILQKKEWLLKDLRRTRDSILKQAKEKGKIVIKAGTKDNPTRQEAALNISNLQFSKLMDEIAYGEQIWDSIIPQHIEIQIQKPLELGLK